MIPPVETSAPLATDAAEPVEAVATEAAETPAATNGETKKELKSEKRKSTLPFLGKKEKALSSDEEGEKPKSPSAFSKLRATIKVCLSFFYPTQRTPPNFVTGPHQVCREVR